MNSNLTKLQLVQNKAGDKVDMFVCKQCINYLYKKLGPIEEASDG